MAENIRSNNEEIERLLKDLSRKLKNGVIIDPEADRERILLVEIEKLTDRETAEKAKFLFHSMYYHYRFVDYLWLLESLVEYLTEGCTPGDAFYLCRTRRMYYLV